MSIKSDLIAALDYIWSGTDSGDWVSSDPTLNGVLINSPTVDDTGLSSQRLLGTTSRFAYAPGNATTHRMASCTWVVRMRRLNTDRGAAIKVGWPTAAVPRQFTVLRGWGFGFGGGTFDSDGSDIILLREGAAWHNFGSSLTPAVDTFASFSIRFSATGVVARIADTALGNVVGLPVAGAGTPYVSFGGYETVGGNNRFSTVKILDVMQFTRDLTSPERLWLADENNSLLGGGAGPLLRVAAAHFFHGF